MRTLPYILLLATLAHFGGCGGGGGRPTGPPAPVADTIRTIEGQLSYLSTGPDLSNIDANGRLVPVKGFLLATLPTTAKFIPIEIVAPDGTVMGTDRTGLDGRFSIDVNFGKNPATQVTVRAIARIDLPFGTKAYVRPFSGADPYMNETLPGGNPADRIMQLNLIIGLNQNAAAYHMLQTLYDGFVTAKLGIATTMPDLDVLWAPGNGGESRFQVVNANLGQLTVAGGITGAATSNTDAWDAPQVARLFGEYLFEYFINETAPDGTPSAANLVPSVAWRAGFLDFWSCVARGSTVFWDTEGSGAEGRVTRYFDIESFFDPALGSLGPDDPNQYQDPAVAGIGSAFTVAEVLWDIHDADHPIFSDNDGIDAFPLFLTLQFLQRPKAGFSYPYLFTLFDEYVRDGSISAVRLDNLMRMPEQHGIFYPATEANGLLWPRFISPDSQPLGPIAPPFDKTVNDKVDTLTPNPIDVELGELSQRYFQIDLLFRSDVTATLTTTGNLVIDIMDFNNNVISTGPSPLTATGLEPRKYVVRVRSTSDPQDAPFDLRLQIVAAPP